MKKKAFFLDRDGVINKNRNDYVKKIDEVEILPYVPEAIRLLNMADILVIIITNQSAINRGIVTIKILDEIHHFLKNELSKYNAKIDGIYFCPHRPDELCNCRKPKPGLIFRAANDLDINLSNSVMIGNSESDLQAAKKAGIKPVLMETNGNLLKIVQSLLSSDE